jgi:tRNA(Ile2) C34 agmatinyltransferase TiaS
MLVVIIPECMQHFKFDRKDYVNDHTPAPVVVKKNLVEVVIVNGLANCPYCGVEMRHIEHFGRSVYHCAKCGLKQKVDVKPNGGVSA